jgi:hypothetical protein
MSFSLCLEERVVGFAVCESDVHSDVDLTPLKVSDHSIENRVRAWNQRFWGADFTR